MTAQPTHPRHHGNRISNGLSPLVERIVPRHQISITVAPQFGLAVAPSKNPLAAALETVYFFQRRETVVFSDDA